MALIEARAEGKPEAKRGAHAKKGTKVVDLASILQKSLAAARKGRGGRRSHAA
jgi:hypothetical protein